MSQLIQFRRGAVASLPASAALGEPLFATDTNELYVGTGTGVALVTGTDVNVKVGSEGSGDYLNESYFEQDGTNHIRIKQNTLLAGVDADKVDGKNVDDAQVSTDYLWTAGKIKTYVDSLINGLDWQESILDRDLATPPVEPTTGDRYIVATSGTDAWVGLDGQIVEWNGTGWTAIVPNEGNSLRVEDEDAQLVYNGTAWVKFGTTTTHNETAGLQGGDVGDYYHLTNVQHADLTDSGVTTLHKHDVDTAELVDDSVTAAKINADVAGLGLVQNVDGSLEVNVDDSTIEVTADALNIKDAGISNAKLADDAVTVDKIHDDVIGKGLVVNGSSIDINVDEESLLAGSLIQRAAYDVIVGSASSINAYVFNNDGTKAYIAARDVDKVYEVDLSTAYDPSSYTYSAVSLDISAQEDNVWGLQLSADGTKLFICGAAGVINVYTLSTAWDLSTATHSTASANIGSSYALEFSPDGTKVFTVATRNITARSLSTAWDVSTMSTVGATLFDYAAKDIAGFVLSDDGTKLGILRALSSDVEIYTLSTAWDLTTAGTPELLNLGTAIVDSIGDADLEIVGTEIYAVSLASMIHVSTSEAWTPTGKVKVQLDGSSLSVSSSGLKVSAIDADTVTVSNLEVDNLKTGVLDTDLTSVSASDDTLASAKAIKSYVDTQVNTGGTALSDHEADTSTHGVTEIVGTSEAQTLTNKTIDASLNTISNLDIADFAATAIETSTDTLTDSDSAIPTSAAVKDYVDAVAQGLAVHEPVRLATAGALTATYDNGTSGVGATLTNSDTQEAFTLDSVAGVVGDRILVKNQANGFENGIYELTTVGDETSNWVLTRAADFDNSPDQEIHDGDFFFVTEGTVNGDNGFVQVEISPLTVGTDAITFVQFSGAGQIVAGDGLSKSGNTLTVNVDDSTLEISTDALRIKDLGVSAAKLADDAVTAAKINADVAGLGLIQNETTGALDINVAQTMQISSDAIAVNYQSTNSITISEDEAGLKADLNAQTSSSVTLSVDGSGLKADVRVDDSTIKIDAVNNYIYVNAIDGGSF